jgi:hypothetical protein
MKYYAHKQVKLFRQLKSLGHAVKRSQAWISRRGNMDISTC